MGHDSIFILFIDLSSTCLKDARMDARNVASIPHGILFPSQGVVPFR